MVPGQWVPVVVVAQQRRVEDLRDVAEAGDLVSARPAREELAVARPEGFFVLVGVSGRMREVGECLDLPS
jgi:hypothetical protein